METVESTSLAVIQSNKNLLMPSRREWDQIKEIAMVAVKSGLLPAAVKTAEAAAIIALKGRELGLPPMVAFSHINVIQGKPTMSAEIMLAYVYKEHPGCEIDIVERSETRCEIHARRANEKKMTKFEWNLDRAKKMGLIGKDNWVKQPGTMMFWRTISEMKRAKFPEVLMGIDYSTEELLDSGMRNVEPIVLPTTPAPETQSIQKAPERHVGPQGPEMDREAKNAEKAKVTKTPPAKEVKNHAPGAKAEEKAVSTPEPAFDAPESTQPAAEDVLPTFKEVWADVANACKAQGVTAQELSDFCKGVVGKSTKQLSDSADVTGLIKCYEQLLKEK